MTTPTTLNGTPALNLYPAAAPTTDIPAPYLALVGKEFVECGDTLDELLSTLREVFEVGLGEDVAIWAHGKELVCVLCSDGRTVWVPPQVHPVRSAILPDAMWHDGPPAHVPPAALAVDRRCCHKLVCPGCGRRGMEYHPRHSGPRYKVLARCGRCLASVEM